MINRSAAIIGHEPAFIGWLKTTGVTEETIRERSLIADRSIYLISPCLHAEELEEVVEDLFEEIFRQELEAWQPDRSRWPDTADFELFTRWFTVETLSEVRDTGRSSIADEEAI